MDHFYQTIDGWCDFADLYARLVSYLPDGACMVEVGCYKGQSTAALAVEILNSGKRIRVDCVDHFQGSAKEDWTPPPDLEAQFRANIAPVRHAIRDIHVEPSTVAARRYADGELDCVWIDAAHDPESVLADLEAWAPKVKPGGVLAGHDYDWPTVRQALDPWATLNGLTVETASLRSWVIQMPLRYQDWSTPAGERSCLVAVACNERMVFRDVAESMVRLGWGSRVTDAAAAHGFRDVQFAWVSRHVRVDDLRNETVAAARGVKASHLLFLDGDMQWPADVLMRMLRHHDQGIVSGLYHLKAWPHWPVAFDQGSVNLQTGEVDYTYDEDVLSHTTLQPAALVGMGCTLIPMAVFERMPGPWFEYRQNRHGLWTITEDVSFCQKAAAIGCPISVDPTVACRHVGVDRVGDAHYMRSRVEMQALAEVQTARRAAPQPEAVPA